MHNFIFFTTEGNHFVEPGENVFVLDSWHLLCTKYGDMLSKADKIIISGVWISCIFSLWLTIKVIPEVYAGLSDELLIHNFQQDGYMSGLYAGMAIAMMSLVDHVAPETLAISVRDDILKSMLCHAYEDCRKDFLDRYEGEEKYQWIRKAKSIKEHKD